MSTSLSSSPCLPPRVGRWPAASNRRARLTPAHKWIWMDAEGQVWFQDAARIGRTWFASHFSPADDRFVSVHWQHHSRLPRVREYRSADALDLPRYGDDYDPQRADFASFTIYRTLNPTRSRTSSKPSYVLSTPIFGAHGRDSYLVIDPPSSTLRLVEFLDQSRTPFAHRPRCSCGAKHGCAHVDLVLAS